MKILVVGTGGTIGSSKIDNIVGVDESMKCYLLELYKETVKDDIEFIFISPIWLLSENMTPNNWTEIIKSIIEADFTSFDGVIVLHGTDTLAYTSSALALAFKQTQVPIVLVSSNFPLEDIRSNGFQNFHDGIVFIKENIPGVFVAYKNPNQVTTIHLGDSLVSSDIYLDEFKSYKDLYFGKIINNVFVWNDENDNPTREYFKSLKKESKFTVPNFSRNVLLIVPYIGLNYNLFDFSNVKPDVILHAVYHSGTVNNGVDLSFSAKKAFEKWHSQGIEVYMVPAKDSEKNIYLSSVGLTNNIVTKIIKTTIETALVTLMKK
jgi:L-asparaginase